MGCTSLPLSSFPIKTHYFGKCNLVGLDSRLVYFPVESKLLSVMRSLFLCLLDSVDDTSLRFLVQHVDVVVAKSVVMSETLASGDMKVSPRL